jgi:hypothetical protein
LSLTKHIGAVIVIGALLWMTTIAAAQDGIISEADFWRRLELTDVLLKDPSGETIAQVNDLWRDVDRVRLPDGTVIRVNVTWLQSNSDKGVAYLEWVRNRVHAILAFHELRTGTDVHSADKLADLNDVLQQQRFRYEGSPSVKSQPSHEDSRATSGSAELMSPSLAQLLLIAVGLSVAIGLLVYLWRMLQVQPAAADLDADAAPDASQAAEDRAEESKAANDYRMAIRQLYLASLLLLDEQGIIRYDAALTNREHLEQLREQPRLRELMVQAVTIFDRVWYGFAPADEALYRSFREHLEQLRRFGR